MIKSSLFANASIRHGYFTREGGVSDGIYGSLNCGAGSSDRAENIIENKRRAAECLGVAANRLVTLHQIHSTNVATVKDATTLMANRPQADAMVTNQPGIALGILTADCAPIFFADPAAHVIGAAHAGWRGALGGLVENTIAAMETLDARRDGIVACVGPCIAQNSYQVGPEFRDAFLAADPNSGAYFLPDTEPEKYRFDLRGFVLSQIENAGVAAPEAIEMDTYEREDLFFSYRRACHRAEDDYGRGLSAIALTG